MNSRLALARVACAAALASFSFASAAETAAPAAPSAEALKTAGLTQAQLVSGAKAGLTALVEVATADMTKSGGVQVGTPSSMSKLESTLKRLNQSAAFDSFKASLNQAATSVAPQTTAVFKAAIDPLSAADAGALLNGQADSATKLLRKTSEANLRTKLMPMISKSLADNGTAAKAKDLLAKAGPMASMMGAPSGADLENHVLNQLLDSTFGYVSKGEAALRANPSQLKDANAQKVFSAGKK